MLQKPLTDKILKGFFEVYNELGSGFLEAVYEKALGIVLVGHGLQVEHQKEIQVFFRNKNIGDFKADIVVEGKVILELKAKKSISTVHESQLINYLRATKIEVGLLLNFGESPQFKRLVYENTRKKCFFDKKTQNHTSEKKEESLAADFRG